MDAQTMRVIAFMTWLVLFGLAIFAIASLGPNTLLSLVLLIIVGLIYKMVVSGMVLKLNDYERAVIFRFGKFLRVAGPGWTFILPGIDEFRRITLRVETVDVGEQKVITSDEISLIVDAVIYLKVTDPKKAVMEVEDYKASSAKLIQAVLRDVISRMTFSEVVANVDKINDMLQKEMSKIAKDWGIEVYRVELERFDIPEDVRQAMHERKKAKELKEAAEQKALAEKITIQTINEAASNLSPQTLAYMYMETLKKMAEGKATKIIFPLEMSKLAESLADRAGIGYDQALNELKKAHRALIAKELEESN